jgi:hypothetical protein
LLYNTVKKYYNEGIKPVRNDLQGLEINLRELQKLTNLPVNDEIIIITNNLKEFVITFVTKAKGSEGATVIFLGMTGFVVSYAVLDIFMRFFLNWVTVPSWILLILFGVFGGSVAQGLLYFRWKERLKVVEESLTYSLKILLNDVERYNAVIKAIDINDQIEAAGNPGVSIKDRQKVIEALKLTRSDLVRALTTERILRENKKFIVNKSELFADNLAALTAMQVTEEASEHGRLLNEALQIALDVQLEMRSLQG